MTKNTRFLFLPILGNSEIIVKASDDKFEQFVKSMERS